MRRRGIAALGAALLVSACGGSPPVPEQDHPLRDVIVDGLRGTASSREELIQRTAGAEVVYLGEKHDNPHHHDAQRWVLERLVASGRRPAVGFEVFDVSQSAALMEYVASGAGALAAHGAGDPGKAVARLRSRLGWGESREESWSAYGPLLELAREHGLEVFGIDLPVALRARISRVGGEGLSANERAMLPAVGEAAPGYREVMLQRLKVAHCGHGSDAYLQRLFENWMLRNETMAGAIVTALGAGAGEPVVVILGAGHTRDGEGVVRRVARQRPGTRQLDLAFQELRDASTQLSDHVGEAVHGLVWLTPPGGVAPGDACRRFMAAAKKSGG